MASVIERDEFIERELTALKFNDIGIGVHAKEEIRKAMIEVWRDGYATGIEEMENKSE